MREDLGTRGEGSPRKRNETPAAGGGPGGGEVGQQVRGWEDGRRSGGRVVLLVGFQKRRKELQKT